MVKQKLCDEPWLVAEALGLLLDDEPKLVDEFCGIAKLSVDSPKLELVCVGIVLRLKEMVEQQADLMVGDKVEKERYKELMA